MPRVSWSEGAEEPRRPRPGLESGADFVARDAWRVRLEMKWGSRVRCYCGVVRCAVHRPAWL